MLERIAERRTDLVFDYVRKGHKPSSKTNGSSLIQWCGYYGDVSAIEFLLEKGETLDSLGKDKRLDAAAFHGHWRLCQFLIESGEDVNSRETDTGDTPLHRTSAPHGPETGFWANECGVSAWCVSFFQPTTQPTTCDVLYDFRAVWQSPRSCKLL